MIRKPIVTAILFTFMLVSPLAAQTRPGPGGGPGGFDPAAIHDRILESFKTALASTDDEWKLLEPKLTKVFLLQLDVAIIPNLMVGGGGRMGGMIGPGGVRGFIRTILDPNAQPSPVEEKSQDLQALIDNNETSTSVYTNALAQLRKAREKAHEQLAAAQKDLVSLLTLRQEATLVQMGLLE